MNTAQKTKDTRKTSSTASASRTNDKKLEIRKQESKPSDKDSRNPGSKKKH
ncbi:hypothetical protein [Flavobacterium sp.]|uniref:hypothetical protein n=1 Tax=Flavobacterium sp. TaxID=239 RepID=UPI0025E64DDB|nr:hypothetical protein [Flavobacterium sp.]